ncbi:MAG: DUF2516 family protein [Acidimicrobiales bacterium]
MEEVGRLLWTVLLVTVSAIPLAISVWALLDCARRPSWAWALAGRNQAGWMAAILLGVLTVIGGLVVSLLYLATIRPRIADAEDGRFPDGFADGP